MRTAPNALTIKSPAAYFFDRCVILIKHKITPITTGDNMFSMTYGVIL